MNRVIVTGATSFIGVPLVDYLIQQGIEIYAVLRSDSAKKKEFVDRFGGRCNIIELDMHEYPKISVLIKEKIDAIVHLSWNGTRGDSRNEVEKQQDNYDCAVNLLKVAPEMGVRHFMSAGSQAEYGMVDGIITEEMPSLPVTQYGKQKYAFYKYAEKFGRENNIRILEPRFFSLYGPNDYEKTLIISSLPRMMANEPCDFSDGLQMWNYLYIDDAIRGLYELLNDEEFPGGIYNFGSDDTRRLRDYIEEMKSITKSSSELHFGALGHNDSGTKGIAPDISKLKSMGWFPRITFAEGIFRIIKSLKK